MRLAKRTNKSRSPDAIADDRPRATSGEINVPGCRPSSQSEGVPEFVEIDDLDADEITDPNAPIPMPPAGGLRRPGDETAPRETIVPQGDEDVAVVIEGIFLKNA